MAFGILSSTTKEGIGIAPEEQPVYSPKASSVNPTPSESPLRNQGRSSGAGFVEEGITSYK
jgi:hypothetical protein